jgi:hypothetical protein
MSAAYEMPANSADMPADLGGVPSATVPGTLTGSLLLVGLLTMLAGAWGGIVPYVGPVFGFGATGTASWTWNLAHGLLGLAPGVVAVVAGLAVVAAAGRNALGLGRAGLAVAGLGALISGAWFVVGPAAWPVLDHGVAYFVGAGSSRQLLDSIGYSFGPGLVLAALGGFTLAKSLRHRVAPTARFATPVVDGAGPTGVPGPGSHLRRVSDQPGSTPMASPQQPMASTQQPMPSPQQPMPSPQQPMPNPIPADPAGH